MSTMRAPLPSPRKGGLAEVVSTNDGVWSERLRLDRERAGQHQSAELASVTLAVQERARAAGAEALLLTGSTARGRRTLVSDLDYHVIGIGSLKVPEVRGDIDLYVDESDRFWKKLRSGDDFVHWSVWYGCILFDSGVVRDAADYVASHNAWPDSERKHPQARRALTFAEQLAETGDYGAALEQVRGALSLTARWFLLSHDVFPLARDELSEQLERLGQRDLARDLRCSIHNRPSITDLRESLKGAHLLLDARQSLGQRFAA
jgi:hypothetical protein